MSLDLAKVHHRYLSSSFTGIWSFCRKLFAIPLGILSYNHTFWDILFRFPHTQIIFAVSPVIVLWTISANSSLFLPFQSFLPCINSGDSTCPWVSLYVIFHHYYRIPLLVILWFIRLLSHGEFLYSWFETFYLFNLIFSGHPHQQTWLSAHFSSELVYENWNLVDFRLVLHRHMIPPNLNSSFICQAVLLKFMDRS